MLTRLRASRAVRMLVRRLGVHRVNMFLRLAQLPARSAVQVVLQWLPRNRHLVVMGSPLDRFADNAAYLYVHMSEHPTGLQVVWISGSNEVVRRLRARGYLAETRWSWRGMLTSIRAGTYVYSAYRSDINGWLCPGALTVSLWHGIPIKRIERDVGPGGERRETLLTRLAGAGREAPPDVVLSTSEFVTKCFSQAFDVPADRCWELGYPRADHLVTSPADPPAALVGDQEAWHRLLSARHVVGLFLTWRDDRVEDVVEEDLAQRLAEICTRHGAVLTYKAHYNVAPTAVPSSCVFLRPDADLNAYLGLCDVLVTDYSSVALDFLLMRRPVVYFMPDFERYAATRGFTVDPMTLPGTVALDAQTLLESLDAVLESPASWSPSPSDDRFLEQVWGNADGNAAQRIVAALQSTLHAKNDRVHVDVGPVSEAARARPAS